MSDADIRENRALKTGESMTTKPVAPKDHFPLRAALITGVPGTGKTTLSKAWCLESNWAYLSLNDLVEEKQLYTGIDSADMAKIVHMTSLKTEAAEWIEKQTKPCLVDGHLGCELRLPVDRVLVLRLHPGELVSRLEKRGYTPAKVHENKMAELLDYCTIRSLKTYRPAQVFEMDVTGLDARKMMARFGEFVGAEKPPSRFSPHVSWGDELLAEAERPDGF